MPTTICLNFSMFPDDTPMPLPFSLAGFNFAFYSNGVQAFVNQSGNDKGLQFPDEGIKIKLPVTSTRIKLKVGTYSTPVTISLADANGNVLTTTTINAANTVVSRTFSLRRKVSLITLTGGNNEGLVSEVCYTV